MQLQKILAWAMLAYGIVYALVLCRDIFRRRAEMGEEKGTFGALAVSQAVVYFFTTMGFPDFILNTLLFQKCGWVADKRLPSTLVASCVLPATVISFSYLSGGEALDAATVILCMLAVAAGSFCGARVMARLDGKTIRLIMGIAMIAFYWLGTARNVRNLVFMYRDREYNLASRCLGTPLMRILGRNIFPYLVSVIILRLALSIPGIIAYETTLSYLGLLDISTPSLGILLRNARSYFLDYPYLLVFPAAIVSLITITFYLVGNAFSDACDPRNHV